jgi:tRNA pseudouridine55 synthase
VVARVRRLLGLKKVGHAGTLDPLATGLLVVGVGRSTRLLTYFSGHYKTYEATVRFGISMTTDDAEGEILQTVGAQDVTTAQIDQVAENYRGDIEQRPAAVSAIKVNGQRAYRLVRQGEAVDLPARPVHILRLDIGPVRASEVHVDGRAVPVADVDMVVDCSAGTYIRSLARDIGADLGVGGHIVALRRVRSGPVAVSEATVDQAVLDRVDRSAPVSQAEAITDEDRASWVVPAIDLVSRIMPTQMITAAELIRVSHGQSLDMVMDEPTAIVTESNDVVAVYRPDHGLARPDIVLMGAS